MECRKLFLTDGVLCEVYCLLFKGILCLLLRWNEYKLDEKLFVFSSSIVDSQPVKRCCSWTKRQRITRYCHWVSKLTVNNGEYSLLCSFYIISGWSSSPVPGFACVECSLPIPTSLVLRTLYYLCMCLIFQPNTTHAHRGGTSPACFMYTTVPKIVRPDVFFSSSRSWPFYSQSDSQPQSRSGRVYFCACPIKRFIHVMMRCSYRLLDAPNAMLLLN